MIDSNTSPLPLVKEESNSNDDSIDKEKAVKRQQKKNSGKTRKKERSRSPVRALIDLVRTSKTSQPRTEAEATAPTTASITDIQTLLDGTTKKIRLKLTSKTTKFEEGQSISISNNRCRLAFDPLASGHLGVVVVKPETLNVSAFHPRQRVLEILVEQKDTAEPNSMTSFLYSEAKVGSHFTIN